MFTEKLYLTGCLHKILRELYKGNKLINKQKMSRYLVEKTYKRNL